MLLNWVTLHVSTYIVAYIVTNVYFCFTVSHSTNMTVVTLNNQIVGQPLMLECEMSTPRGINSRVDIVWTRDGVEVERINDVSSNFSSPEVVVYTNIYTIPLLGTIDDDVVYECEVIISSNLLHNIAGNVTLDVIGMCTIKHHDNYYTYLFYFYSSCTSYFNITT